MLFLFKGGEREDTNRIERQSAFVVGLRVKKKTNLTTPFIPTL